jgi:hypothetical protein
MTWIGLDTTFGYSPPARRPAMASHDLNAERIAGDSTVVPFPPQLPAQQSAGQCLASFAPQALSRLRQSLKPNPHSRDR